MKNFYLNVSSRHTYIICVQIIIIDLSTIKLFLHQQLCKEYGVVMSEEYPETKRAFIKNLFLEIFRKRLTQHFKCLGKFVDRQLSFVICIPGTATFKKFAWYGIFLLSNLNKI